MALDLSSLEKAVRSLEQALSTYDHLSAAEGSIEKELMRDGIIQRFEYTFELSWKMIKRFLEEYSLERPDGFTNKELFRVGHEKGLIRDVEAWFDYIKNRNLTSHTYSEDTANQVYESARSFLGDAQYLLSCLQEKIR